MFCHLEKTHVKEITSEIFFLIDGRNFFNKPVNDSIINENIRTIATGQGDNYATGCLLPYNYFKSYYEMIAIDLSKQQVLDADPKVKQQLNFTENLERAGKATIFFIIEEVKQAIPDFSQGAVKVFQIYFTLI